MARKAGTLERLFRWYLLVNLTAVWIVGGMMWLTSSWNSEVGRGWFDLTNAMWKHGVLLGIVYVLFCAARSLWRAGFSGLRRPLEGAVKMIDSLGMGPKSKPREPKVK